MLARRTQSCRPVAQQRLDGHLYVSASSRRWSYEASLNQDADGDLRGPRVCPTPRRGGVRQRLSLSFRAYR